MTRPWLGAAMFAMIPLPVIAMTWLPQNVVDQAAVVVSDLAFRWIIPTMFVLIFAQIGYRLFKADRR